MKVLDIPLHLQTKGSEDCGPTGSLMILDYFGITSDSAEVLSKVPRCNFGTSSFDNANTLMDYGLNVELVTAFRLFTRAKNSVEPSFARMRT